MRLVRSVLIIWMLASRVMPAWADSVLLSNGRKLEGIVVSEENDPSVVLEVGPGGRVVLAKEEVMWIVRSEAPEQKALEESWQKKRLDSEVVFQQGGAESRLRSHPEPGRLLRQVDIETIDLPPNPERES